MATRAGALRLRQAREAERPSTCAQTADRELHGNSRATLPYLAGGPAIAASSMHDNARKLLAAMPGLKERAKTLVELIDGARFLFAERPLALDDKARTAGAEAARRSSALCCRS